MRVCKIKMKLSLTETDSFNSVTCFKQSTWMAATFLDYHRPTNHIIIVVIIICNTWSLWFIERSWKWFNWRVSTGVSFASSHYYKYQVYSCCRCYRCLINGKPVLDLSWVKGLGVIIPTLLYRLYLYIITRLEGVVAHLTSFLRA